MIKWWVVFALGGVFVLAPGMIDPLAVINGSTLVGLGLLAWATLKIVNTENKKERQRV